MKGVQKKRWKSTPWKMGSSLFDGVDWERWKKNKIPLELSKVPTALELFSLRSRRNKKDQDGPRRTLILMEAQDGPRRTLILKKGPKQTKRDPDFDEGPRRTKKDPDFEEGPRRTKEDPDFEDCGEVPLVERGGEIIFNIFKMENYSQISRSRYH